MSEFIRPIPLVFFSVLAFYFVLMAAIGWVCSKKTDSLKEFFVMSGSAGALISGFAYFATQYSMSTFMGVPATCYQVGFAGLSVSVPGLVFSMIIPALIVGRVLMKLGHKYGFLTLSDYLVDRYESPALGGLQALLMILFMVPMMGAQTIGAGVIFHAYTGAPEWIGIVGMGLIVILYCMSGGIRGAMVTDVIQGGLMLATAIVTFFVSLKLGGGISQINAKLAELNVAYLSHPGAAGSYPWGNYVSMIIMWSFFSISQPTLVTKFFAMKNYRVMFKAVLLGTAGMWLAATLIEWAGVNAIVSLPGLTGKNIDFIVPLILQQKLAPVLSSILIAGIMAAGMSTIDSLLIAATGAVTRDLYQKHLRPTATDQEVLKLSRWVTVTLGVIAVLFGISRPGTIFTVVLFAYGGLGIWATPVLLGLYWKKATKIGAVASIIIGEALFVVMTLWRPNWAFGFNPLIVSWLYSFILMIVVSLFTAKPTSATIKRHFELEA